ncbi:MAG: MATE family efflux transporter [Myxococcota bacterium]|nr:MATE family efflux transporter [Myxococcota bacterium]
MSPSATRTGSSQPGATPPRTLASTWREVMEATRGARRDYTSEPLGRAIFLLAVPMVLEMVMESLFAVADVFWVGRLGAPAVATVGLTETIMVLVYTVAMGLGVAATAVIARRVGEGDRESASRAAVQAIILGVVISGAMAAGGAVFAPRLLQLMGASPDVSTTGTTFVRVMLGGSSSAFLLFVMNSSFRAAGDPSLSLRVLWLSNAINIILGPLLIFGVGPFPRLGLTGAAVGTTIGRGVGVLYATTKLVQGRGTLSLRWRHLGFEPRTMARLLRLALNGTFQMLVGSLNWVALVRVVAAFGSVAMSGYTIAIRLVVFALLTAWGLANAAATLVGQSLGARDAKRAEQSAWTAARYNAAFLAVTGAVYIVLARPIVSAFTSDPTVADVAVYGLRVISAGFPLFAFGMVLTQAFNGAGDTFTPTMINIGVFWLFEVPLALLLVARTPLQWRAVFIAVLAAYSLLAVVSAIVFRRSRWKKGRV